MVVSSLRSLQSLLRFLNITIHNNECTCNAHESAKIIRIYYLSLEYNFPSRNSENLGFPESVKELNGQGGVLGF